MKKYFDNAVAKIKNRIKSQSASDWCVEFSWNNLAIEYVKLFFYIIKNILTNIYWVPFTLG